MKPIGEPNPERDRQMDLGAEILDAAAVRMEEAGVEREPTLTLLLLTAATVAIDDIDDLSADGEVLVRAAFMKEAGDAFTIIAETMRKEATANDGAVN